MNSEVEVKCLFVILPLRGFVKNVTTSSSNNCLQLGETQIVCWRIQTIPLERNEIANIHPSGNIGNNWLLSFTFSHLFSPSLGFLEWEEKLFVTLSYIRFHSQLINPFAWMTRGCCNVHLFSRHYFRRNILLCALEPTRKQGRLTTWSIWGLFFITIEAKEYSRQINFQVKWVFFWNRGFITTNSIGLFLSF